MKIWIALVVFSMALISIEAKDSDDQAIGRVYKGQSATLGQIPHQALLYMIMNNSQYSFCGGSLISVNYVLSAAHCTIGQNNVVIFLGLVDITARDSAFRTSAKSIWNHPNYNPQTFANDISILELAQPASLNEYIQTIKLPSRSQPNADSFKNVYATVSGWGRTYNNEVGEHRILQFKSLYTMSTLGCQLALPFRGINPSQICTDKLINLLASACEGDSGGPLTYYSPSGPVLIGIVSFKVGLNCVNANPTVFTYPGRFLDVIQQVTGIAL